MRAKLQIINVGKSEDMSAEYAFETLTFRAVYKSEYDSTGADEDNTFSRFTPQADLTMVIQNPALFGRFEVGQKFYVDFTEAL